MPWLTEQAAKFSREDLLRLFDALLKVESNLRYATQTRFQLEMGLIELAQIPRMRSLAALIADFTRLVQGGTPKATPGQISSPLATAKSRPPVTPDSPGAPAEKEPLPAAPRGIRNPVSAPSPQMAPPVMAAPAANPPADAVGDSAQELCLG